MEESKDRLCSISIQFTFFALILSISLRFDLLNLWNKQTSFCFELSNLWKKQSSLRFDLSNLWNKQNLLRFNLSKVYNKQGSLRFNLYKFWNKQVRFALISKTKPRSKLRSAFCFDNVAKKGQEGSISMAQRKPVLIRPLARTWPLSGLVWYYLGNETSPFYV